MEKICVIGSNSFSGATFVAYALEQGLEVLGISRSAEAEAAFLPYRWPAMSKYKKTFHFEQLDMNRHAEEIGAVLRSFAPAYVVNFAAQSMVGQSWENPVDWYETNVVGHVKLHEKLRKLDSLKKYVQASTPEVYGSCSGTVKEDFPFNPSTPYAASKAACDLHLNTYFKHYGFPVVSTRAANVYGPGQQLYRIIPRAVISIATGKTLELHGGGHSVRSFIHMRDVSDATLRIAKHGRAGECYHISTDRFISVRDLVQMICTMMGYEFDKLVKIVDERPGKDAAYLLDCSKLRSELGWAEQISLESGVQQTIDWVQTHLPTLKSAAWDYQHKH
ncbi:MAG: GDP-mannose 4,6-dehydratase [Oligoflexia bacterium]|nr:GDP-mannose 4,6-dehydratase [Oligoflexia bacterium]